MSGAETDATAPVRRGYEWKGISAQLQAYSESAMTGVQICTWMLRFPRWLLAEVNTHGMLRRNAASSRAIPVAEMIRRVEADPAVTVYWGANEKGMQSFSEVEHVDEARAWWLRGAHAAVAHAREGAERGIHKQFVNRVLEPYMYVEVLLTGTDVSNFFNLRAHTAAEPNFQILAALMLKTLHDSRPAVLTRSEWHVPFPDAAGGYATELERLLAHAGRAARLSYLTHDGRKSWEEDVALAKRLMESKHWSPFEQIARPMDTDEYFGPFRGWSSLRRQFKDEAGPSDPWWYLHSEARARVTEVFDRFGVSPIDLAVKSAPASAQE